MNVRIVDDRITCDYRIENEPMTGAFRLILLADGKTVTQYSSCDRNYLVTKGEYWAKNKYFFAPEVD